MARIRFAGPLSLRFASFVTLNRIAIQTYWRHFRGKPLAPDWDANLEIGIRFWRHQFTAAMEDENFARGRLRFDSLQMETDDVYEVKKEAGPQGQGTWYRPRQSQKERQGDDVLLYYHGGGYAFHGAMSDRFAAMLCHHTGLSLYAPDYRLTPEHRHPAQAEDAMTAWDLVRKDYPAAKIILVGDSAGGHMALMHLQELKRERGEQPRLCIGLCPWTDIGERGESLTANDAYDLVQGWMALTFGRWLDPEGRYGREKLSPIFQDYTDLAPIYLQAGGREVLRDMIVAFADKQKALGANVILDLWPDMPHDFQAYDSLKASSREALSRIVEVIRRSGGAA